MKLDFSLEIKIKKPNEQIAHWADLFWLRGQGSNLRWRSQSPLCYRYTTPKFGATDRN